MRIQRFLATVVLAICIVIPFSQVQAADQPPTITVQGSSQWDIAPDVAYIQLAVVTNAASVSEAQTENARIANNVYSQLYAAGLNQEYIKTAQYSVVPVYQQEDGKKVSVPVIRGYQITNGFTVTTSPAKAGEIIDLALQAGANQVTSVRFGKQDEAVSKQAALQAAVKDAWAKAEAIASALGKRISNAQSVNETGVYLQMPEVARYSMKAADSAPTPISPGLLHLNANVQLVVVME
jgi:hypothetical protein